MPKITIHFPGAVLKTLLDEHQITLAKFARDLQISPSTARLIALGKTKISVPVAIKFAKYFSTTAEYWLGLQNKADLAEAAKDTELTQILKGITKAQKTPPAPKKPRVKNTPAKPRVRAPVPAAPKKKDKPVTPSKTPSTAGPKKRGRKPKIKPVAAPIQEKPFVPHVILIKKKDIVVPVPETPPVPQDE